LSTAGLGLAFALVSVGVHDAMSALVFCRGGENIVEPSGPTAAIALAKVKSRKSAAVISPSSTSYRLRAAAAAACRTSNIFRRR
jgi:hypothetical protein